MTLLAAEIVERFYMFLWPMLRISALLVTAPLFSLDALTLPIRIMMALVVTIFVYPLLQATTLPKATCPRICSPIGTARKLSSTIESMIT